MANKIFTKIAMSKPAGKLLNKPVVKNIMVPVGNKIIKTIKNNTPGKLVSNAIRIESKMRRLQNEEYIRNAPYGAYGTNTYREDKPIKKNKKGR